MFGFFKKKSKAEEGSPTNAPRADAAPKSSSSPAPAASPQSGSAPAPEAPKPAGEESEIEISLAQAIKILPEPLKQTVAQAPDNNARIKVRAVNVKEQLKGGAVKITFGQLKSVAAGGTFKEVTTHDAKKVNLPMKDVLSTFTKEDWALREDQKVIQVPDSIPAVFGAEGRQAHAQRTSGSGAPAEKKAAPASAPAPTPKPAAPPAPAPAPKPTAPAPAPAPKPAAPAPAPAPAAAPKAAPSKAKPSEVLEKLIALKNVAGGVLATDDGLSLAKKLPDGINADALCGFLPEILKRIGNYTQELKLGSPTTILVTLKDRQLLAGASGKIYFGVVSNPGASLPLEDIQKVSQSIEALNQ